MANKVTEIYRLIQAMPTPEMEQFVAEILSLNNQNAKSAYSIIKSPGVNVALQYILEILPERRKQENEAAQKAYQAYSSAAQAYGQPIPGYPPGAMYSMGAHQYPQGYYAPQASYYNARPQYPQAQYPPEQAAEQYAQQYQYMQTQYSNPADQYAQAQQSIPPQPPSQPQGAPQQQAPMQYNQQEYPQPPN